MLKNCKIIIILFFITFPFTSESHVQHYNNLNHVEFDIYRNDKNIGKHTFSFIKKDNQFTMIIIFSEL